MLTRPPASRFWRKPASNVVSDSLSLRVTMPSNAWALLLLGLVMNCRPGMAVSVPPVSLLTSVKPMSEKNVGSKLAWASRMRVWSMAVSNPATRMSRLLATARWMISCRVIFTTGPASATAGWVVGLATDSAPGA